MSTDPALSSGLSATSPVTVKTCVKDFIYMGTVIKTSLDLGSGQELKFSRFEPDPDLHEGDERWLCWDPAKSVPIHLEAQEVRS